MLTDEKTTKEGLWKAVEWVRNTRLFGVLFWARYIIAISLTVFALLWQAYVLGQEISENLSTDYLRVQESQSTLISDALQFRDDLLNPKVSFDLDTRLKEVRQLSLATVSELGALRSPSNKITDAKTEFRTALEELIGVANRLSRTSDFDGTGLVLHNALQGVADAGGDFNDAISHFQGGMIPQLWAAVF